MTYILIVALLLVLGLALVVIEVLVLPGVGFIGALGVALTLSAGVVAHMRLPETEAMLAIGGGLSATILAFWLLPKTRAAKSMVLTAKVHGTGADSSLLALEGRAGITTTALRPAGVAQINDSLIDVISDSEYIAPNTRVRVAQVEGNRVVVQTID
ncbi:MAG: hypothetical protein GY811_09950 [Myxococcales bacterium]|nr:hypothetical protein [Myxococcales bacterium]